MIERNLNVYSHEGVPGANSTMFDRIALFRCRATAQTADDLLKSGQEALRKRMHEALKLAGQAIKADPKSIPALYLRITIYEQTDKYAEAVADLTTVLALDKMQTEVYQHRGLLQFKSGKIKASIADFDAYIERSPQGENQPLAARHLLLLRRPV